MNDRIPTVSRSLTLLLLAARLASCDGGPAERAEQRRIDASITCSNGLTVADSITYMSGGGGSFAPTLMDSVSVTASIPEGMVLVRGGEFSMGSVNPLGMREGGVEGMDDARPVHRVRVTSFLMDATEVTNAQFAAFVEATGYVTVAERTPTAEEFPDAPPGSLVAGSPVFTPPSSPVPLDDHLMWWSYVKGADWRHPEGPDSHIRDRMDHPVVHVSWTDAEAYAKWAGKRLPSEAEWEYAARGGVSGALFAWGNQLQPDGRHMANIFQGEFPVRNTASDGYTATAPVKKFPANAFGLYDIGGNVWEWCADWYRPDYYRTLERAGTVARDPRGPKDSYDPQEPGLPKRVQRGGSFLCHDRYCTRYMVGTRGKGEVSSAANHIGFRCVKDL